MRLFPFLFSFNLFSSAVMKAKLTVLILLVWFSPFA